MTARPAGVDGLAVVDKPAGWTSHDVVARCRKVVGQKRVGHAGTLDPDATGVLLVGFGRATRLLRFLQALPKTYRGEVVLGTATTTLDAAGDVVGTWDMSAVTLDDVRSAATAFVGDILQVPPMVSAIQIGGRRLHDLAREGIEVEREPRPVTVHRLDVTGEVEAGVFAIEVECSAGTYIRTLAADIGTALGGGAHLRNLRRTRIGSFADGDATPLEELTPAHLLPPVEALRGSRRLVAGVDAVTAVSHGKRLPKPETPAATDEEATPADEGPWAVVDGDGALLGVYEDNGDGTLRPLVVLAAG